MTQPERNHQTAINTIVRDDIYKAVLAVLSQQGVGAFTMERVAEAAGIAKGSIYNHFKNKDDLLRFVYRQTLSPLKERGELVMKQATSTREKLEALVRTWFCGITENRAIFEFLIHDRSVKRMVDTIPDRARDICIVQGKQVFEEGIEKGEFRSDLPASLLAELLFGATSDVIIHQVAREKTVDTEEVIQTIIRVFIEGIKPV